MEFDELLRAYGFVDVDLATVPEQHPERTSLCPPEPRIIAGVREGWKKEEQEHVHFCPFCQLNTSFVWREAGCPDIFSLTRLLALGTDRIAMDFHIVRDRCQRCPAAMERPFVKTLAEWIGTGKRDLEDVRSLASRGAFFRLDFPTVAGPAAFGQTAEAEKVSRSVQEAGSSVAGISRKGPVALVSVSAAPGTALAQLILPSGRVCGIVLEERPSGIGVRGSIVLPPDVVAAAEADGAVFIEIVPPLE